MGFVSLMARGVFSDEFVRVEMVGVAIVAGQFDRAGFGENHKGVSEGLLWTNSKRRPPPLRTMCFSSAFLATSSSLAPFTPNQGYSLANRLCQPSLLTAFDAIPCRPSFGPSLPTILAICPCSPSFGDLPLPLPLLTIPDYQPLLTCPSSVQLRSRSALLTLFTWSTCSSLAPVTIHDIVCFSIPFELPMNEAHPFALHFPIAFTSHC